MKSFITVLKYTVFVLVPILCWKVIPGFFPANENSPETRTSIMFDRTKIKAIKELELLTLPYGDINHQSFLNKSGEEVAYIDYMYNGIGRLTIDLEKVELKEGQDSMGNLTNLTVRMPPIKMGGARILHHSSTETNEFEWTSGSIGEIKTAQNVTIDDLERSARVDAQRTIEKYIMSSANIFLARERAESILRILLAGPENVKIAFVWPSQN